MLKRTAYHQLVAYAPRDCPGSFLLFLACGAADTVHTLRDPEMHAAQAGVAMQLTQSWSQRVFDTSLEAFVLVLRNLTFIFGAPTTADWSRARGSEEGFGLQDGVGKGGKGAEKPLDVPGVERAIRNSWKACGAFMAEAKRGVVNVDQAEERRQRRSTFFVTLHLQLKVLERALLKPGSKAVTPPITRDNFKCGDRVQHKKHGEGTVHEAPPDDIRLYVAFDSGGRHRFNAASLATGKVQPVRKLMFDELYDLTKPVTTLQLFVKRLERVLKHVKAHPLTKVRTA